MVYREILDTSVRKKHHLKCSSEYYKRVLYGEKTFEHRVNDRGFSAPCELVLYETHQTKSGMLGFTGSTLNVSVEYCLELDAPSPKDVHEVVMSLNQILVNKKIAVVDARKQWDLNQ